MVIQGKWMPHEIKGCRKLTLFLCERLQSDGFAHTTFDKKGIRVQRIRLKKKFKISYDASKSLEYYFNAILYNEPLPASLPTRRTIDKLTLGLPSLRCDLDSIREFRGFSDDDFRPVEIQPPEGAIYRNRFSDCMSALEYLVNLSALNKRTKGFIKGALMSYQIARTSSTRKRFINFVRRYKEISWYIVIQDSQSEIINSICDVMNLDVAWFKNVENNISSMAMELNEYIWQYGGAVYVIPEKNIIKGDIQGVFYREWCCTLPSSQRIDYRNHPVMDLVRFEDLGDIHAEEIKAVGKGGEKSKITSFH